MCGIIASYGGTHDQIERALPTLYHRGPDAQGISQTGAVLLGHTRLAIIDLDDRSNQPFTYGDTVITFNGEIWNYVALRIQLQAAGLTFTTAGDTEVLAAALDYWGTEALSRIEGMFAVAWSSDGGDSLSVARDRFGEVPVHIARQRPFWTASEIRALHAAGVNPKAIDLLDPGMMMTITATEVITQTWYVPDPAMRIQDCRPQAAQEVERLIGHGVQERLIADVPVCVLLSGGIDSAAIASALIRNIPDLVAYTAVMNPRSRDLRTARETAYVLGIELREIPIPSPSLDDLARVIRVIEQPFKAQIEIGWACLHLAEAIAADGFRVTYSGEGSDELWASYGFAYHGLQKQGWYDYRRTLFRDQARKNFVRCNKIFMAHSIECRLPFLSTPLVEYALGLSQEAVQDGKGRPKAIMQDAFQKRLPESVVNRPKMAFQDGLGLKEDISARYPQVKRFYAAEYVNVIAGRQEQHIARRRY